EPLDSFARKTVEAICGRDDPTLVGPGGRRRKYDAAELLFAWLVEPERWERVPFIKAADPDLRSDALGLPLRDADGRRPAFVSPGEVDDNPRLDRYLSELQLRIEKEGKDFRQSELDREVERLAEAYGRYRRLTFDADRLKTMPRRFFNRIRTAGDACRKLITDGQCIQRIVKNKQVRDLTVELVECRKRLIALSHKGELSREKLEPAAADFRGTAEKLADLLAGDADKPLAGLAAELRREAVEMHLALYDNGDVLRLVPALNPAALEENRKQNDDAPPWLAFQALIVGSDELLRGYPRPRLEAARTALAEAKAAYLDAQSPNRPANFADAMNRFADSLRSLAEEIEPSRRRLPLQHRDEPLLDATAYPPPGATAAEVFYNRLDPFFWSWLAGLVSSLFLLSAAGRWRRPAFWSGAAALVVSLGLVIAGLGLRAYITGLAPLTGMFESVVVVAAFVYALGLWLALLPCVGMGGTADWADVPSAAKRSSVGEQILRRRLFALAGAIVGTLALALAYYAPASVMRRNIGAAVPILRDNFWLVVHVVTIMAGYASAAIALIIGNVALGYYLFGRYAGRRTPPACATLAGFIYSAVKITVLLLAAGTILGALWADVSWGRFWGWDPKEVWALVSLLVYLWFLHARRVGLSGDFGMALTAVLGATVILFNWYGVNFILGIGLHAYATGAGGQWQVTAAVALQWFFLLAAAGRYLMERGRSDMPQAMEN
ncbi:MAG: cytochrome c biogenesis protein CcsA, partial [Pirellulales bacterium]|nr:cytochrome c biogenesis protein CcsA [Pirellulales bacterium]